MSYLIRLGALLLGTFLCGLAVIADFPIESMMAWIPGVALILIAIYVPR